jgi:hypothetical protein
MVGVKEKEYIAALISSTVATCGRPGTRVPFGFIILSTTGIVSECGVPSKVN